MYVDDLTLVADRIPFDQDSNVLYVGAQPQVGNWGEPIMMFVQGDVVYDIANSPALVIEETLDDQNPAWNEAMRIGLGETALSNRGFVFAIPTHIVAFIRLRLENVDSGIWTAGVLIRPL